MTNRETLFEYLDALRDSGVTNMFGAGPYLQEAFGLSRYEAKDVVLAWMQTFRERQKVSPNE
jgi:hypothetical protein